MQAIKISRKLLNIILKRKRRKQRFRDSEDDIMHYCYVYGGKKNLSFHGWLNGTTIERLEKESCVVEIQDYEYQINNDEESEYDTYWWR